MTRAAPDGYTILLNAPGHTTNPTLMKLAFDSIRDFAFVTQVADGLHNGFNIRDDCGFKPGTVRGGRVLAVEPADRRFQKAQSWCRWTGCLWGTWIGCCSLWADGDGE